jgi:DNA topoisomerase IA
MPRFFTTSTRCVARKLDEESTKAHERNPSQDPAQKGIEANLMAEARKATHLMIWTDCDREGEHIGSEVADVCRKANPRIVVKRARFSAIIAK